MNKIEEARNCFSSGFNCSQSVFSTFCKELGLDKETGLKISSSFGGGMAHLDQTCGAVTGAFMAIGLKYGRTIADDKTAKEKNNAIVREFAKRFTDKFGSLSCTDLIGYNLSTEEGLKKAAEEGRFHNYCSKYVETAVEILEELI